MFFFHPRPQVVQDFSHQQSIGRLSNFEPATSWWLIDQEWREWCDFSWVLGTSKLEPIKLRDLERFHHTCDVLEDSKIGEEPSNYEGKQLEFPAVDLHFHQLETLKTSYPDTFLYSSRPKWWPLKMLHYGWWKKSQTTTWDVSNPAVK